MNQILNRKFVVLALAAYIGAMLGMLVVNLQARIVTRLWFTGLEEVALAGAVVFLVAQIIRVRWSSTSTSTKEWVVVAGLAGFVVAIIAMIIARDFHLAAGGI